MELVCNGPTITHEDKDHERREKSKKIALDTERFLQVRLPRVDEEDQDLYALVVRFLVWHPNKPEILLVANSSSLYLFHVHMLKESLGDSRELEDVLAQPNPDQKGVAVLSTLLDETVTCAVFTNSGSHLIYGNNLGNVRIMAMPKVKSAERYVEQVRGWGGVICVLLR